MFIKKPLPKPHALGEPILHENHKRPVTRRELLAAGLGSGPAMVLAPAWLGSLLKAGTAQGQALPLSDDIKALAGNAQCDVSSTTNGLIPFICFDLAGGANLVGSEVIVGQQGGQQNFLSTAGYGKMGLPGNMVPSVSSTFVSSALGLLWHSDGAILRGILSKATTPATAAGTDGGVICAMSQNDTGTNPHNPIYGIARIAQSIKTKGKLLNLIGTNSSVSGGNSQAPMYMIDPQYQPATIQRPQDATALVPTNGATVSPVDVAVMESQVRISAGTQSYTAGNNGTFTGAFAPPGGGNPGTLFYTPGSDPSYQADDAKLKQQLRCGAVQATNTSAVFFNPALLLDATKDPNITGGTPIFTAADFQDNDVAKTATVMKLVLNGFAMAGTITMGGYDYHDSTRATGESRNFKAGQMIGAVLEYAQRVGSPVMIYVISDGSLTSNSMVDTSTAGRNKLAWQGDNESVASTFFLVYKPGGGRAALRNPATTGRQIGYFSSDGAVVSTSSPAANSVVQIAETALLNYMALHTKLDGQFQSVFQTQGLGSMTVQESMKVFAPFF